MPYCRFMHQRPHLLTIEETESLGFKLLKRGDKKKILAAIKRICDHPVWMHPYNTDRMRAVQDSLSKNQNSEKAFRDVGLNLGWALSEDLDPEWAGR